MNGERSSSGCKTDHVEAIAAIEQIRSLTVEHISLTIYVDMAMIKKAVQANRPREKTRI
jgi:hypothetical protein